jgi:phenylpropionate dioxygenase-like ring-hydroxylating dioxygenase large terminal subunit
MHTKKMITSRVSPFTSDILATDSRPLPPGLALQGNHHPEPKPISFSRYTDPVFAKLEMEKLWMKTWQYACRTEDIPEVGDRVPYDVGADLSVFIVRSGPNEFKAFHNACRHRGTRLVNAATSGDVIRCPFHAWQWKPDGAIDNIPCRWDFEGNGAAGSFDLKPVQVGVWNGYVFINPDLSAGPLNEALGMLPVLFEGKDQADRYTVAYVHKKVRCNWKTLIEAFLEAYHVLETHPQALAYLGDATSSYDIWETDKGHVSRLISPSGVPSPHLGDGASVRDALIATATKFAPPGTPIPEFEDTIGGGRAQLAEWRRTLMSKADGRDYSDCSDSEILDSTQFFMFPNFLPWFGEGLPLEYQFLPYGSNPNESVFITRLTKLVPANRPRPPAAAIRYLDFDESLTGRVPEMGALAGVFDQDFSNLPFVQKGMQTAAPDARRPQLASYMEQRIQHFENVLGRVLGID